MQITCGAFIGMLQLAWFPAAELACQHHEHADIPARRRHVTSGTCVFPGLQAGAARTRRLPLLGHPVTGLPWLAGVLAALMIVVAAVAAARLCWWRLRGRPAEADADALHVLMGVAMAGMFEPGIGPVPAIAWQAVFALAAAWFTWQALRRRSGTSSGARDSHPAAHVVECGAMLYMLWPAGASHRAARMPGMTGHAGAIAGNPVIAFVLAIVMLGFIVWAIDRLLSRPRPRPRAGVGTVHFGDVYTGRGGGPQPIPIRAGLRPNRAAGLPLAPRLAAFQKVTMGLAMGYMLLTMM
jgi:Domain of unknown function (DUF5134)